MSSPHLQRWASVFFPHLCTFLGHVEYARLTACCKSLHSLKPTTKSLWVATWLHSAEGNLRVALTNAVKAKQLDVARSLLRIRRGTPPDFRPAERSGELDSLVRSVALMNDTEFVLEFFVFLGKCNIEYPQRHFDVAMESAARMKNREMIVRLVELGSSPECAFWTTAENGDIQLAKWYLDTFETPVMFAFRTSAALHTAVRGGWYDYIEFIFDLGMPVRSNALRTAESVNRLDIYDLLVRHGANPDNSMESDSSCSDPGNGLFD